MATGDQRPASRGLALGLALVVIAAVGALVAWNLRPQEPDRPFEMNSPSFELLAVPGTTTCEGSAAGPFVPSSVSISGVVRNARVMALPRDENNVPGTPPTSAKYAFAWDRPGIKPGSDRGNVLLNAHTWPDGSAVGNVMLDELDEGDRIVLRGGPSTACYSVTKRLEVRASKGYAAYYDREGSPKVALIVCSGKRTGPGEWTHRTIWFAEPVA